MLTNVETDIDDKNIQFAQNNVSKNGLEPRIRVIKTEPSAPLIPLDTRISLERYGVVKKYNVAEFVRLRQKHRLNFTMCNPPFYESQDEMVASAEAKARPPFSVRIALQTK